MTAKYVCSWYYACDSLTIAYLAAASSLARLRSTWNREVVRASLPTILSQQLRKTSSPVVCSDNFTSTASCTSLSSQRWRPSSSYIVRFSFQGHPWNSVKGSGLGSRLGNWYGQFCCHKPPSGQCWAANFMRFCFCRWLQNHTRTTFFFRSSFSAIAAIFSPDGRGCTAKYASNDRFSGAAMLVLFRFFSPAGKTDGASGSRLLFFAWASASSSHACRIGFSAIMLLCDNVSDSNRHIVDCESAPTPGNFKFASALPTSACVTPNLMRLCLNLSANASNSRGSVSASGWRPAAAAAAAAAAIAGWWWAGCGTLPPPPLRFPWWWWWPIIPFMPP